MNYLAHAYLSFNNPQLLVGNMISDFVKGKTKFNYPPEVQNGIMLHRAIDEFTDGHPATKKAKEFFKPAYRLYSGAFVDIVFDHFLALDKNEFSSIEDLQYFTNKTYKTLQQNFELLPKNFQNILPHMIRHDWLCNYQYRSGIEKSFGGLVYRAKYIEDSSSAFEVFNKNYMQLEDCFKIFFPSLKKFAFHNVHDLSLA